MKNNIQPKIEKLLKSLAKKEPKFITIFNSDSELEPQIRLKQRNELARKHIEIETFGIINQCKVSVGPFSFVFYNDDFRYLGYYRNGSIEVDRKQV